MAMSIIDLNNNSKVSFSFPKFALALPRYFLNNF